MAIVALFAMLIQIIRLDLHLRLDLQIALSVKTPVPGVETQYFVFVLTLDSAFKLSCYYSDYS